jgi:hypothetical protein
MAGAAEHDQVSGLLVTSTLVSAMVNMEIVRGIADGTPAFPKL